MNASDTTSSVELDALVVKIQGVMSAEQIKAIETLDLASQSISEELLSLGDSASESGPDVTTSTSALSQTAQMGGPIGIPGGGGDSGMSAIGDGMATQSTPAATKSNINASAIQLTQCYFRH